MTETVNYINFEKCKMPKRDEYGYDAYVVIKRQNLTSDIQELVVKL